MAEMFDAVVIGGGAAGLMCALTAGQRGRRVLVVEHANRVGKKILMSGGGRCNFTNTGTTPAQFPVGESAFLQIGAGALHAVGLRRDGRTPRHRVPREGTRAAVLRRIVEADRRHAARRMRQRRRAHRDRLQRRARAARRWRLPRPHDARCVQCAQPRRRHRRPVDSQHGRDRFRLRTRAPVRPRRAADARGPGAADAQRQAPGADGGPEWRRVPGDRAVRRHELSAISC